MNKNHKDKIEKARKMLMDAKKIIDEVEVDERESFENLSENLQSSESGEKMIENVEELYNISYDLENILQNLECVIL